MAPAGRPELLFPARHEAMALAVTAFGLQIGSMRPAPSLALSACLLGACLPPFTTVDAGPLTLNSPCDPGAKVDPCMPWGYVCDMVGAGYSCQYAEFDDPCLPSVGCDPDAGQLFCAEFSLDGGPEAFCGTPCNVPSDCLDYTETCLPAYLADGGLTNSCQTNSCGTLFGPCPLSYDGGPGSCVPIDEFGDGVCDQTGPVAVNGSCSADPMDGGAYLCQPDEQCRFGNSGTTLVCLAVCDGFGGPNGPTCPGSTGCVEGYNLCLTPCNPSSPDCPSPLVCDYVIGDNSMIIGSYCTPP